MAKTRKEVEQSLLVRGNTKMGERIWCFNIPAGGKYCPGKTGLCNDRCYAQRGMFVMPNVRSKHEANYEASRLGDFTARIIAEVKKVNAGIVRIHTSGDMYSARYVQKWYEIAEACPDTIFYAYTRSWRDDRSKTMKGTLQIRKALFAFAKLPNVKLWFSVDAETGQPPADTPKEVRIAYMSISDSDRPAENTSVVFRDYPMRDSPQRFSDGCFVCPPENGFPELEKVTCSRCKVCWNDKPVPTQRVALPMVA